MKFYRYPKNLAPVLGAGHGGRGNEGKIVVLVLALLFAVIFPAHAALVDESLEDARKSVYKGEYENAIERAQESLENEPQNLKALQILGESFYLMGEKSRAIKIWRRILEVEPENKAIQEILKNACENCEVLEDSNSPGPDTPAAEALKRGDYRSAILKAQFRLDEDPHNIQAYETMGLAFFLMREYKRAQRVWERGYRIDPDNGFLKFWLKVRVE